VTPLISRAGVLRAGVLLLLASLSNGAALVQASERITPVNADALGAELAARNGRVVLVNFWATWCRPCLEEIPALMQLEANLREQGFDLIAVSLDDPDAGSIEPFLDKWFPEFRSFVSLESDMDKMVSVIDPYWNEVLPTSYVIARDGAVVKRIQGGSSADDFTAVIRPLLEGNATLDSPDTGN
jgi:cytochrome c biogenesis protein CcmG/thiol:disulfide interchange protein DsbE